MTVRRIATAAIALAIASCAAPETRIEAGADIDQRIRFYSLKLQGHERLYPVYVQLASAYLDKARVTFDPRWLAEARQALHRSLSIVATHEAFVVMAQLSNYSHRFEEAVMWGRRALEPLSEVPDPGVVAILVEAHSALGQYEQARALLPPNAGDFYTAIAWASWWSSQRRFDEAAAAYVAAARLAHTADAVRLEGWARIMAGGLALDAGKPGQARPHLDAAARIDPRDPLLRRHEAEFLMATGRPAHALAVYETLLEPGPGDPDVHAAAYRTAIAARHRQAARRHFDAAVHGYRRALDAGEVHTLGALAALYIDGAVELDAAAALSQWNLWFRRDAAARALATIGRAD